MSYDILVFDPAHAPRERVAFLEWWHVQADWSEPHPYNDPAFTTPALRAWFLEMIERFPALNGPYAAPRDQRAADYCIGYHLIYMAMWFDKKAAHERAYELAGKHRLGFFEASSADGEIWLPGEGTKLVLVSRSDEWMRPRHQMPISDPRIATLVASHPAGGAIVRDWALTENPERVVHVFYNRKNTIEAITSALLPTGHKRGLADLEGALAAAGISYAVVERHEQEEFARQLDNALSAAKNA